MECKFPPCDQRHNSDPTHLSPFDQSFLEFMYFQVIYESDELLNLLFCVGLGTDNRYTLFYIYSLVYIRFETGFSFVFFSSLSFKRKNLFCTILVFLSVHVVTLSSLLRFYLGVRMSVSKNWFYTSCM